MYPVLEFVKSYHSVEKDNDGQTVIYLDDGPYTFNVCTLCDEEYNPDDSDVDDVCPECWKASCSQPAVFRRWLR